jgi:diguanylate cyclase (GGDEF)-like protein/putative nucleotidyltransferase with HDIG domain
MTWSELPTKAKGYLISAYLIAIPVSALCFGSADEYSWYWVALTIASFLVAGINVSLPQLPSILVSMGDVFTVLSFLHFGPGPALITYWANAVSSAFTRYFKTYGRSFLKNVSPYRLAFNLACCSFSIYVMGLTFDVTARLLLDRPYAFALQVMTIALAWFLVNTGTLSLALALASQSSFWGVWRKGLGLYLVNFFGSTAAAGIIKLFYERTDISIVLLSIPLAAVLYQLHSFYVQKDQQTRRRIEDLNKLYLQTVETLATAVDAKDRYTHGHIRRVQVFSVELARCMGVTDETEIMALRAGALLHDIGKIAIPEYILNKPTALTESEYEKMKLHPAVGTNMLKSIDFPYPVIPMVRSHHERWDGNGYPDRLIGQQIPLSARILSLADCYDALTTDRPYRSPMPRQELIAFFQRESGKAYDPAVVDALINNMDRIAEAGNDISLAVKEDIWGIREAVTASPSNLRPLDRAQPVVAYGKALSGDSQTQGHLFSVFEFARSKFHCLTTKDILLFMGTKIEELVAFDAAVFYVADLHEGVVRATHVVGKETKCLLNQSMPLEQKLSGWVAANNHSLFNLPPFPDFITFQGEKPVFEMSAIAPMNKSGTILGAVALYRKERNKFTEEEYRRLEIVAGQTATALANKLASERTNSLVDSLTGLPNTYQLFLMFDQLTVDAEKFDYPLALIAFRLDERNIERRWGHDLANELIRTVGNYLRSELRETDLLVRYADDEFLAVLPRTDRDKAEELKSRLQNYLDHLGVAVRPGVEVTIPVSVGIAMFPADGTSLDSLADVAAWGIREDAELRMAIRRTIEASSTGIDPNNAALQRRLDRA